jgi:Sulfatase-modifying factor enzyme 1
MVDRSRLTDLESLLDLLYEKLGVFEQEIILSTSVAVQFELKQRIKREIMPSIRRYEAEYWELYPQDEIVIPEEAATSQLVKVERAVNAIELVSIFHFGETITTDIVNFDGNYVYGNAPKGKYLAKTTPVGSYKVANNFGLSDMHGNVWEWCQDYWHSDYQDAPTDGSARLDSKSSKSNFKVLRGGSWYNNPENCRSAFRIINYPDVRYDYVGFRVVLPARTL